VQALKRFLLQPIKRFLQAILLGFFGLLLGRSASDEFSVGENDRWKNWMGRIHHLEKNVTDTVDGSEDRVKASFHKAVEDSETSVKASVGALETRLATIEKSVKASVDASLQASVAALETRLATIENSVKASVESSQASADSLQVSVVALEIKLDITLKEILLRLEKMEKK
jgi:hypothetical protein